MNLLFSLTQFSLLNYFQKLQYSNFTGQFIIRTVHVYDQTGKRPPALQCILPTSTIHKCPATDKAAIRINFNVYSINMFWVEIGTHHLNDNELICHNMADFFILYTKSILILKDRSTSGKVNPFTQIPNFSLGFPSSGTL